MSKYRQKVHLVGVNCGRGIGGRPQLYAERAEFMALPVHRRCAYCNGSNAPRSAPYKPRGKVLPLLAAVSEDRMRIFSVSEAARLMNVPNRAVMAMVGHALRAEVIFRGKDEAGATVLRGTKFANVDPHARPRRVTPQSRKARKDTWEPSPDDVRIPRVDPDWKPPTMSAPRAGSGR